MLGFFSLWGRFVYFLFPICDEFYDSEVKYWLLTTDCAGTVSDLYMAARSRLSAQIEKIPPQDSFHASKQVCHLLRSGVAALFGPESGTTSTHIQSICDAMEIPHIETRWDFVQRKEDYSINLYPNPKTISRVNIPRTEVWSPPYVELFSINARLVATTFH